MSRIVRNMAQCKKCEQVVESKFVHDIVPCTCGAIFVDGGLDYLRRGGDLSRLIELSQVEKEDEIG